MANDNLKQNITPRWKGFNLVDIFSTGFSRYPRLGPYYFKEDDFRMIADWGFDFVRLPLSYRCLTSSEYPFVLSEEGIAKIDEAVAFGEKYGIHINLCLHRAPGFCINDDELEPFGWLDDSPAKDYFCRMWCDFARHYKGVSSNQLSFNFINEPDEKSRIGPNLTRPAYAELMLRLIKEVHAIDPETNAVTLEATAGTKKENPTVDEQGEPMVVTTRGKVPSHMTVKEPEVPQEGEGMMPPSRQPRQVRPGGRPVRYR